MGIQPPSGPWQAPGGAPPPPQDGVPMPPPTAPQWPVANYANSYGGVDPGPPQPLRTAVTLMYVGAGIKVLDILSAFALKDDIEEMVIEDNPTFNRSDVDSAVNAALGFVAIGGMIAVGLWIWMAIMNRQGKQWARVTATVFGVIGVLFTTLNMANGQLPAFSMVIALATIVLAIVILFLLYQPDSSRYYQERSGPRGMASPYQMRPPPYG